MGPLLLLLALGGTKTPGPAPVIMLPPPPVLAPEPAQPLAVTSPDWVRRPTAEAVLKVYPPRARGAGQEGDATLQCTVTAGGKLTACNVANELPSGGGFGKAAMRLASQFQMQSVALDGEPVAGSRVNIPLHWSPPAGAAAKPTVHPHIIVNPDWLRRPNGQDFQRYYPPDALEQDLAGDATVRCEVIFDGTLANCVILSQSPADAGFGKASLRVAAYFRMRPMSRDGVPVSGAAVEIPVHWSASP